MFEACAHGHAGIAEALMDKGANIEAEFVRGKATFRRVEAYLGSG